MNIGRLRSPPLYAIETMSEQTTLSKKSIDFLMRSPPEAVRCDCVGDCFRRRISQFAVRQFLPSPGDRNALIVAQRQVPANAKICTKYEAGHLLQDHRVTVIRIVISYIYDHSVADIKCGVRPMRVLACVPESMLHVLHQRGFPRVIAVRCEEDCIRRPPECHVGEPTQQARRSGELRRIENFTLPSIERLAVVAVRNEPRRRW